MIKRILVPLDGSRLAERALRVAGDLAEALSGVLLLVRVVAPVRPETAYAPNLATELEEAEGKHATAYLAEVAQRLREDRLETETRVLRGAIAATVAREAAKERCDVIVISSHGLGGVGSRVFGSVAQQLLQGAPCPVLVVRSTRSELEAEEEAEEEAADEAMLGRLAKG